MTVDEIKAAVINARKAIVWAQTSGLDHLPVLDIGGSLEAARALVALHDIVALYVQAETQSDHVARERVYEQLWQTVIK